MSGVTISINEVSPLLARVKSAAQAQGLALIGARAAGQLVREHLFGLDGQRHEYGRHYYAQAARSVTTGIAPQGAAISVTQIGFRLRLFGGVVTPKNVKYLTIPATPEAYAHRAREFNDLDFSIVEREGRLVPALVRRLSTPIRFLRRKQADGSIKTSVKAGAVRGGEVMFWLVKQTTHAADPSVLPYNEQMTSAAVGAITTRLMRPSDGGSNK